MGLDMYAIAIKRDQISNPDDPFDPQPVDPANANAEEIDYWRKFNNLHGWMERLAVAKGFDGVFNTTKLLLTPADIDALEAATNDPTTQLQPVGGFFFGSLGECNSDDIEDIRDFVKTARARQADGYNVYYDSWW